MRKFFHIIFLLLVVITGFSSCTTYYYSVLSSTDRYVDRSLDGDFIQEDDTVCIVYSFYGEDAPVKITIYNKLNEPLFVDWKRSAIIIDDEATSYYTGIVSPDSNYPSGMDVIYPQAMIRHQPLTLANFSFHKIPDNTYRKSKYVKDNSEIATIQTKEYTEEDSPLYFRSYLTLYTDEDSPKSLHYERTFYISRLIKAGDLSPDAFGVTRRQSGDTFYVRHTKGKTFGYAVASIAVIAAAVAVEVYVGSDDDYY